MSGHLHCGRCDHEHDHTFGFDDDDQVIELTPCLEEGCECPGPAGVERADPDKPCPHPDFTAVVTVGRLTPDGQPETDETVPNAFVAEVRVSCTACGEPFRFIGLEAGMMPNRPMVSVDETELRAPIRPASSDPDFGMGIPGFAVRFREGPAFPDAEPG